VTDEAHPAANTQESIGFPACHFQRDAKDRAFVLWSCSAISPTIRLVRKLLYTSVRCLNMLRNA
jgi:hypothetical protein